MLAVLDSRRFCMVAEVESVIVAVDSVPALTCRLRSRSSEMNFDGRIVQFPLGGYTDLRDDLGTCRWLGSSYNGLPGWRRSKVNTR